MDTCPFKRTVNIRTAEFILKEHSSTLDEFAKAHPNASWAGNAHVYVDKEALDDFVQKKFTLENIVHWLSVEIAELYDPTETHQIGDWSIVTGTLENGCEYLGLLTGGKYHEYIDGDYCGFVTTWEQLVDKWEYDDGIGQWDKDFGHGRRS